MAEHPEESLEAGIESYDLARRLYAEVLEAPPFEVRRQRVQLLIDSFGIFLGAVRAWEAQIGPLNTDAVAIIGTRALAALRSAVVEETRRRLAPDVLHRLDLMHLCMRHARRPQRLREALAPYHTLTGHDFDQTFFYAPFPEERERSRDGQLGLGDAARGPSLALAYRRFMEEVPETRTASSGASGVASGRQAGRLGHCTEPETLSSRRQEKEVDARLVIAAMDALHASADEVVVASNDTDFLPLKARFAEAGRPFRQVALGHLLEGRPPAARLRDPVFDGLVGDRITPREVLEEVRFTIAHRSNGSSEPYRPLAALEYRRLMEKLEAPPGPPPRLQ